MFSFNLFFLDYFLIIIVLLYISYLLYNINFKKLNKLSWTLTLFRLLIITSYILLLLFFFYLNFLKIDLKLIIKKFYNIIVGVNLNKLFDFIIILLFVFLILLLLLYINYLKIIFQSLHYFLYFTNLNYIKFCNKIMNFYMYYLIKYKYLFIYKNNIYSIDTIIKYLLLLPIFLILIFLSNDFINNNYILYHYYYIIIWIPFMLFLLNLIQFYTIKKKNYIDDNLIVCCIYKFEQLQIIEYKYIENINDKN